MLTKNDLILLLTEMQSSGINVNKYLNKLVLKEGIDLETIKFINDNRHLDVSNFYEMIRKNYNSKKSPLYKNIVKEEFNAEDVLSTLAALNLQIILYSKKLENNQLFLKHSRAEEITRVLNNYFKNYDLLPCFKLLRLIKADLKLFENIR